MSTIATNGVSLLSLQEQVSQIAALIAAQMGNQPIPAASARGAVPVVSAGNGKAKSRKSKGSNAVAAIPAAASVPVVTGLPAYHRSPKRDNGIMLQVVTIGELEDGTPVKMGVHKTFGYGFQIGDGRSKWMMGAKWITICQLAPQIRAYVDSH